MRRHAECGGDDRAGQQPQTRTNCHDILGFLWNNSGTNRYFKMAG